MWPEFYVRIHFVAQNFCSEYILWPKSYVADTFCGEYILFRYMFCCGYVLHVYV